MKYGPLKGDLLHTPCIPHTTQGPIHQNPLKEVREPYYRAHITTLRLEVFGGVGCSRLLGAFWPRV